MNHKVLRALALVSAIALTACSPSEDPKQTAEPGTARPAEKTLSEKAREMAKEATEATAEKIGAVATAASQAAGQAKATMSEASVAAMEKGQEMAQAAIDKANALIQQVKDSIAENKPDLAETFMEQLRQLRDSLPQGLQDEIAKLEVMLRGAPPAAAPAGN